MNSMVRVILCLVITLMCLETPIAPVKSVMASPGQVVHLPPAGALLITASAVTLIGMSGAVQSIGSLSGTELLRYVDLRPKLQCDHACLILLAQTHYSRVEKALKEQARDKILDELKRVIRDALSGCRQFSALTIGVDGNGDYKVERNITLRAPTTLYHAVYLPPGRYTTSATWGIDLNRDGWAETRVGWGGSIQFKCSP